MSGNQFCSHGGSLEFSCTSYIHTQLCFPSEPISNRFSQRFYQEFTPNHNSQHPTKTYSIYFSLGDSPTLSPCLDPPQILPKGTCSFNRPRCSSLNRINASTELLVMNFFFWLSPLFLHVNITTTISPKGYIGIPIAQYSPPPHPSHPLPLKQCLNTHEPICQ